MSTNRRAATETTGRVTTNAATFRGRSLKKFTMDEIAQICVDEAIATGNPVMEPTVQEAVCLIRSDVTIELSNETRQLESLYKPDYSVLEL